MADLENMRVKELIVYYLKSEKREHAAHKDEIIEYVRSSQPEHVRKGLRTPAGITSYLNKLKREGILSTEGLEKGFYGLAERGDNEIT